MLDKSLVNRSPGWQVVLLFILSPLALLQCAGPEPSESKAALSKQVIARVGDREITEEEIQEKIQGQMLKVKNQIYTIKKRAIDAMVAELLLEEEAQKRNLTKEQLIQQEVNTKATKVNDTEVEQYYTANQRRFKKPLEEIKPQIVRQLTNTKRRQRSTAFYQELRKAAQVKIFLQPPIIQVTIDGAPGRGPDNAPVTIVEFSDFQ